MSKIEETKLYNIEDELNKEIERTLQKIITDLISEGYDAYMQLSGYIISGDPTYIPRACNARNIITEFELQKVVECLLKRFHEVK